MDPETGLPSLGSSIPKGGRHEATFSLLRAHRERRWTGEPLHRACRLRPSDLGVADRSVVHRSTQDRALVRGLGLSRAGRRCSSDRQTEPYMRAFARLGLHGEGAMRQLGLLCEKACTEVPGRALALYVLG